MAAPKKKRWKWSEHEEWKGQEAEPEQLTHRSGTCTECGNGSFMLKINAGRMDRVCKECNHETKNI